jgi:beta-N-acetylhexosaminidase
MIEDAKTSFDPGSPWVRKTLASLSLEEKIGQLLHPNARPQKETDEIDAAMPPVRPGGVFLFPGDTAQYLGAVEHIQARSGSSGGAADAIPVLISSDLESGAGRMIRDCALFPDLMSLAACGEGEEGRALARAMGEATAREARARGVHWCLGPVVDVNAHPRNPITGTRSLGDRPATVAALARELVVSMQADGLCATAKHFPGDGWDDRDQHLCTSVNPLSKEDWEANSAVPFRAAIDSGVWSVMTGHIALPWADPGVAGDPYGPPPATLSRLLTTELLRGALGFRGIVISDAIEMAGATGRVKDASELLIRMLNAGNDMLLFSNAKRDFALILRAVREGFVREARVDEACSRVLALKEVLGFARNPESALPAEVLRGGASGGRPGRGGENSTGKKSDAPAKEPANALPSPEDAARYKTSARSMAEGAITLVRDHSGVLPLSIEKGDEILAVHLRAFPSYHVDGIDELLRGRGAVVTRKTEADDIYWYRTQDYARYKAILFFWVYGPTWGANVVRPGHSALRSLWFTVHEHPPCPIVNVSFGSPYIHDEAPWALTWINAYSPDPESQRAALGALLGEIPFKGRSPVELERPGRLRTAAAALLAKEGRE